MKDGKDRTENLALEQTAKAVRPLARVAPIAISTVDSSDCCALALCHDLLPMVEYPAPAVDPFDGLPDCESVFGRARTMDFVPDVLASCTLEDTAA